MEDKIDCYVRLTEASTRCGNFNTMDEQMTIFIEGLNPSHKCIVSQHRQDNPFVPFLRMVNYAKAQGAAILAREKKP